MTLNDIVLQKLSTNSYHFSQSSVLFFFFHTVYNPFFPAALYNYIATARP